MAKKVSPPATRPPQQPPRAGKPGVGSITVRQTVTEQTVTQVTGPLPTPQILSEYNQVEPGLANRIVAMAESQLTHQHRQEDRIVRETLARQRWGQVLAFLLTGGTIAGGFWLVAGGHEGGGAAAIVASVAAVVTVYLKGKQSEAKTASPSPEPKELPETKN